jgi:hypothetical protein
MKLSIVAALSLLVSSNCFAAELVRDAEIVKVGSSTSNVNPNFVITVKGGTGLCAGKLITFPFDRSVIFYETMQSMAITAFLKGAKVTVKDSYDRKDCNQADYIEMITG